MPKISFDVTEQDLDLIDKLVSRAVLMGLARGPVMPEHWYKRDTMLLDLVAVNANGCPMDFAAMLEADDFNFTHDVAGIARHMDRDTGKLKDCFCPRFAKLDAAA